MINTLWKLNRQLYMATCECTPQVRESSSEQALECPASRTKVTKENRFCSLYTAPPCVQNFPTLFVPRSVPVSSGFGISGVSRGVLRPSLA